MKTGRGTYSVTKQLRDNVFELFHGPEKDIPETPLDVARPMAAGLPVAEAGSAVDLIGKPKIIMLMAPGSAGKSTFARWMVERALNRDDAPELVLASADAQNPTLKRFFPTTMVPQSAGGVTQFLMTLLDKLIGRKMSAVIDMGGDMTLAPVLTQGIDLQQIMLDAGIEPVVFYLLTPRQSDLAVLKTMETMEFRPTATCLLRNLGRTTNPSAPDEEQYGEFARIRKHSAYRGVVARGAVEAWMPRLWPAREIEDNGFGFYQATNGGRLGEFARRQTSRWLTDMELVMAPVSSWLP